MQVRETAARGNTKEEKENNYGRHAPTLKLVAWR